MTIKTIAFIHSLLIKAEHDAALELDFNREDYYQIVDDWKNHLVFKSVYEAATEEHDRLVAEHDKAFCALREFEEHEWR